MKDQVFENTVELCKILKANYYKNGSTLDYSFDFVEGRKYYKVVMVNNQHSVHAFVDRKTGDIYKPATWNAPAKGVRFNIIKDLELLRKRADWAGGYLYR